MALAGEVSIAQALFFALSPPRARVMIRHAAGGEGCFSLERARLRLWVHDEDYVVRQTALEGSIPRVSDGLEPVGSAS